MRHVPDLRDVRIEMSLIKFEFIKIVLGYLGHNIIRCTKVRCNRYLLKAFPHISIGGD